MKNNKFIYITILIVAILFSQIVLAQEDGENTKIAQTGFQFLTVGTDARAAALGEAFTTVEGSSNSLFYNPAGMASLKSFADLSLNRMEWIGDINYLSGTVGFGIEDGKYGIVGLSFSHIDYGEFLFTRVAGNEKGYVDIKEFSKPFSFSVGLGYAKELSNKFSVGGQIKYVKQNLGDSYLPSEILDSLGNKTGKYTIGDKQNYQLGVLAFDFGTLYKTGYKSLTFGMSVRNFAGEVKYEKEGFQLPLVFKIGISMDLIDFYEELKEHHKFMLRIDAAHPRSHPEFISVGGEYIFMDMVALRAGYITGQDLYDFTAGFGIKQFGFELNYAYTPYLEFNDIHRISLGFAL
ncbi:MAG: PorV/PorQ family protein [Melioribacteraceae bacterium]